MPHSPQPWHQKKKTSHAQPLPNHARLPCPPHAQSQALAAARCSSGTAGPAVHRPARLEFRSLAASLGACVCVSKAPRAAVLSWPSSSSSPVLSPVTVARHGCHCHRRHGPRFHFHHLASPRLASLRLPPPFPFRCPQTPNPRPLTSSQRPQQAMLRAPALCQKTLCRPSPASPVAARQNSPGARLACSGAIPSLPTLPASCAYRGHHTPPA